MDIKVAKSAGFCFGVKRAVDKVYDLAGHLDGNVCTLGPIIHNESVVTDLLEHGVSTIDDISDVPDENTTVVIRSHGVAASVIDELKKRGIGYEDVTCPFVKKIHTTVRSYSEKGYEIVIIGDPDHPEVKGILGWSLNGGKVLKDALSADSYEASTPGAKVCVVAQTTFNSKKFKDLVEIISKKGYNLNIVNTICHATRQRQEEAERLAVASDAMIVIGGCASSNSRKLFDICKQQCKSTFFIQTADDLKDINIGEFASLGITAGASTPKTIIQEVVRACQKK